MITKTIKISAELVFDDNDELKAIRNDLSGSEFNLNEICAVSASLVEEYIEVLVEQYNGNKEQLEAESLRLIQHMISTTRRIDKV